MKCTLVKNIIQTLEGLAWFCFVCYELKYTLKGKANLKQNGVEIEASADLGKILTQVTLSHCS